MAVKADIVRFCVVNLPAPVIVTLSEPTPFCTVKTLSVSAADPLLKLTGPKVAFVNISGLTVELS